MLKYNTIKYAAYVLLFILLYSSCVKSYSPAAIKASNSYLVVDGFINTGVNGITTIVLSRSKNLLDTTSFIPEKNAQIQIADSNGTTFPLIDSNNNGRYSSAPLILNQNDRYRVTISTSDGHQYLSDFVSSKTTP